MTLEGPVKQEALVELHCRCNVCGARWIVASEVIWQWDTVCCWSTTVREVPGQMVFSDAGGAWTRRPWIHGRAP